MSTTALKLIVKLWHDDCYEDPCDMDGWKVHSFGRRHSNRVEPEDIGFDYDYDKGCHVPGDELQAKLDSGLAFMLDYYEHGQCMWSLSGEGPQCRWDTASFAGVIIWESDEGDLGPKSREDREKDARAFIQNYTAWCNGYVFGFTIDVVRPCHACGKDEEVPDDEHDVETTSCGGFIIDAGDDESLDWMIGVIKENIGSDWASYEVEFDEQDAYGMADEIKSRWKEAS